MEVPARQMFPDLLAPGQFDAGPDQVLCPTRDCTDGVDIDDHWGGCRPDVPSGSSSSVNSARGSAHPCVGHGW
jgi:hypothetical protein